MFEYRVENPKSLDGLKAELQKRDGEGWEFVAIERHAGNLPGWAVIFRRPQSR